MLITGVKKWAHTIVLLRRTSDIEKVAQGRLSKSQHAGREGEIAEPYPVSSSIPCATFSPSPTSSFCPTIYTQPPITDSTGEAKPGIARPTATE